MSVKSNWGSRLPIGVKAEAIAALERLEREEEAHRNGTSVYDPTEEQKRHFLPVPANQARVFGLGNIARELGITRKALEKMVSLTLDPAERVPLRGGCGRPFAYSKDLDDWIARMRLTGRYYKRSFKPLAGTYFVQAREGGLIKIGKATSLLQRFSGLQTGSPKPLCILGFIEGVENEAKLHKRFAQFRMQGEWFLPAEALLKYIDEHRWFGEYSK